MAFQRSSSLDAMAITEYGNSGLDHAAARKHGRDLTVFKLQGRASRHNTLHKRQETIERQESERSEFIKILDHANLIIVSLYYLRGDVRKNETFSHYSDP